MDWEKEVEISLRPTKLKGLQIPGDAQRGGRSRETTSSGASKGAGQSLLPGSVGKSAGHQPAAGAEGRREGCTEGRRDAGRDGGRDGGAEGCREGWRGRKDARRDGEEEEGCRREGRRAGSGWVADSTIAWHSTAGTATAQSRGVTPAPVPWTGNYSQHPRASVSPTAAPCSAVPGPGKARAAPSNTQHPTDARPAVGTAAVSPWQKLEDSRRGRVWRQTEEGVQGCHHLTAGQKGLEAPGDSRGAAGGDTQMTVGPQPQVTCSPCRTQPLLLLL